MTNWTEEDRRVLENAPPEVNWYKVSHVVRLLQISRKQVLDLIRDGHLKAVKDKAAPNSPYRVREDWLREYSDNRWGMS